MNSLEEIKVGEYVRTTNKGIRQIAMIDNHKTVNKYLYYIGEDFEGKSYAYIKTTEILKHSFNLIDLVEVGDYVNGHRVEQVSIETNEVLLDHNGFGWRTLKYGDKIVTHEQFASIEYKLEEEK